MPIGGKIAFLSKVTFRRESNWVSKTKQMLKGIKTIEERAEEYAVIAKIRGDMPLELAEKVYIEIATEQKEIDIDTIPQLYVRWLMIDGEKPSWKEYATKAMEEEQL